MKIYQVPYGPLSSNMYVVTSEEAVFIIDPSVEPEVIEKQIDLTKLAGLFITHAHFDHIYAVEKYIEKHPEVPVFMSDIDVRLLGDSKLNCFDMVGIDKKYDFKTIDSRCFKDKSFGNITVTTIETPGHTAGSVCYMFKSGDKMVLFSGDTLFKYSMGRTDFPTGDYTEMMKSLSRLSEMDKSLVVYPGHGTDTTIEDEVNNNPYFF